MDLRFTSSLQIMLSLAYAEVLDEVPLPSAQLAIGLGVPASFVRKLVTPLAKAQLVYATMGKNGGIRLAREAKNIQLSEIFDAIFAGTPVWSMRNDIPHRCLVTSQITNFVSELSSNAYAVIKQTLGTWTLEDALHRLEKMNLTDQLGRVTAGSLPAKR